MCFAYDALPPDLPADLALPRLAGGAAAEKLELVSADGTRFSAALAPAPDAQPTGVAILPDVRGLYRFYIELAERFAQAGHSAITLDFFGRTAGLGERGEDFDYMPHVMQTTVEQVQADLAAAIAALRGRTSVEKVVVLGFCFGGMQSFLASTAAGLDIDGAVGFYGLLDGSRFGLPSPKDAVATARVPVLGLFGGADAAIPPADVERFTASLQAAGVAHDVVTYPEAPHSFFDRRQADWAEACEDAWRRVLAFARAA